MTRPAVLTWNGCLPTHCVDITLRVKSRSNTTHLLFPSLWLSKGLPPYLWWPGLQYWPGMAASHHAVWTLHWRWSQGQIQPTYDFLLCSCQKGYLRISDDQACSTDPEWLPSTTLCGHYTEGEVKVKYNPHMISFFVAVKRVTSVSLMTRPAVLTRNGCLPSTTLCGHYTEGEVKVKYNPLMISFFVAVKGLPPYLWWPGLQYWPGMAASHHAVWTLHWRWSQGQIQPTYDLLLCSCQKGYLRISDDQACSTDPEWLPPTTLCGHYTEGEVKVKYNPLSISFFVAVKRVTSVSLMTRPAVLTRNGCLPPRCVDITLKVKSRSNTTHLVFPSL